MYTYTHVCLKTNNNNKMNNKLRIMKICKYVNILRKLE